jgi:hypothetical protein
MATLETIYRNQLGRAPDAGGLAHYQAQIASGRSIDDIRQEIANSPEARSRGVGAYASGGGGGGGTSAPAQPKEVKYNQAFGMEGLPTGGPGYAQTYSALQAAANQRRDLFSGGGKSNLSKLGIKEGYSFTGGEGKVLVDSIRYSGSGRYSGGTLNIYKDAPAAAPTTTPAATPESTPATTNTETPATVTNPYQSQIDTLTTQLGTISGQIGGYTDTINTLRGQISDMQTGFGNQLKTIMDANTKALEDMNTQYQTQLREQQEAQELARQQRELAAQTAAANQARAGQQAEFSLGSTPMRGIFGGLAGFKRRGKVKASTSDALSIGAATEKSPNKMLNV